MSNATCSQQNLNVKHVATLFEEVQNRYVNKLISIDEKFVSPDERHKVKKVHIDEATQLQLTQTIIETFSFVFSSVFSKN